MPPAAHVLSHLRVSCLIKFEPNSEEQMSAAVPRLLRRVIGVLIFEGSE